MKYIFFLIFSVIFLYSQDKIFSAIPKSVEFDKNKMELGKKLFFDPILSKNDTISCASCHDLSSGGDDGQKISIGIDEKLGKFNAPTVFNARFNFVQFWDGRSKDLFEQSIHPIINDFEMGSENIPALLEKLKNSKYNKEFKKIYKDGVTQHNLQDALSQYGSSLITPNSKFDKYIQGDSSALRAEEIEGLELFKEIGCSICHHGVNLGGNLYARFGVLGRAYTKELGKYNVTKDEKDRYVFKVPSLRNIALTSPYFHDGRFKTLYEAIEFMAKYQLGKELEKENVKKIEAFLETLTGEVPEYVY